jgi:5S rRNA maturation endonuclease (ribonuclease M5)
MASASIDFGKLAPQIAAKLLDKPNSAMSTATILRFGSHGSMAIDLEAGTFYDHEANRGGGMLDLIKHRRDCDTAGALSWLEDEGLKDREPPPAEVWQIGTRRTGPIFYDYRDEHGDIISRVKRTPDKRFWQLGPDGRGGFHATTGCMDGVRRVPYRLPELLAADPSRVVFVVEGEKDADRLATLGLVATTNAQGAGKFLPDLVPYFAGRKVVVIADNDSAGRDHVADVVAKLTGVAAVVTALALPGLNEKGDASDWLDAGGTVEQLKDLSRDALERPVAALDTATAPVVPLVSATPYVWRAASAIKPREWVYGRSIQRGHLRAVVAQGGAGKTILSVGEALAMATGRNLLGQEVPGGPKRVWLWNLEDDGDELARIVQAACIHWRITEADIGGRLFIDSALDGATLKTAASSPAGLIINRPIITAVTEEMRAREIDYLHVDPFVSSHSANESDNMEIDAIAKEWAMVAKNANVGVGLAHHISKAGAGEATAMHARGASALINACRSVLVLNRMSEEEAKRYGIEDERRRRFFRVYDDKNNRAPPSDKSDWYQMASVSLGNGLNDDGDNMGVVVPWSPPDAFEGVTAEHLLQVQTKVAAGKWRHDAQAKAWVGIPVAEVIHLSPDATAKSDRARINALLGTWYSTGALIKVEGKDDKSNPRTFVEVGEWAVQGVSPTSQGGVRNGVEGGEPNRPHHTLPPVRGKGGEGGSAAEKAGGEVRRFVAGNPALGVDRSKPGMVLAPGKDGDIVDF